MPGMCSRQALHTILLGLRWNAEVANSLCGFRPLYVMTLNIIIESQTISLNALHMKTKNIQIIVQLHFI